MLLEKDRVEDEIKELRESMKGLGTDEDKLIEILGTKTPKQMSQLMLRYHHSYGKTLYQHVSGEVTGYFGSICKGLSVPIIEYDVDLIYNALDKVFSANYSILSELLVGRTNHDLIELKKLFKDKYGVDLEVKIREKCYGNMGKLYILCLEANREENRIYTDEEINNDVETLFKATKSTWGINEMVIIKMLCTRQFQHLRNVFYSYEKKYNTTITNLIENEFFGTIKENLLILVKSAMNRQQYVTEEFRNKILKANLKKLIRYVIRYRTPLIIDGIKETYTSLYKTSMGNDIRATFGTDRTSDFLLLLLNENTIDSKSKELKRSISAFEKNENGIEIAIEE